MKRISGPLAAAIIVISGLGRETGAEITWVEVTTKTEFAVSTKGNVSCDEGISSAYLDTYSVDVQEQNRGGLLLQIYGDIRSGSGISRADMRVDPDSANQSDEPRFNEDKAHVRAEISQVRDGYIDSGVSSLTYDFGPDGGSFSGSLWVVGFFPDGDLVFDYHRPQGLIDRMICEGAGIVEVEFRSTFTQ